MKRIPSVNKKYIEKIYEYLNVYIKNRVKRDEDKVNYTSLLTYYGLNKIDNISKEMILESKEVNYYY